MHPCPNIQPQIVKITKSQLLVHHSSSTIKPLFKHPTQRLGPNGPLMNPLPLNSQLISLEGSRYCNDWRWRRAAEGQRRWKTEGAAEKEEKDDEDHRSWWRSMVVAWTVSWPQLHGSVVRAFRVTILRLPLFPPFPSAPWPRVPFFFSPLPLVPLPPVSWFVPPAFPVLLPSSALLATNRAPLHLCANERESNTARPIRSSSKLPVFLRAAVTGEESWGCEMLGPAFLFWGFVS